MIFHSVSFPLFRKASSGGSRMIIFYFKPICNGFGIITTPKFINLKYHKRKCHFKRKAFTTLRFHLLQNVSILYEQKTHPTKPISICKEKIQTMESIFNQKHGPNNSSSRWGLIASSGSHLLLVLLTLAGIDGGRAALMKFYPGTMSCPKLALLSLVMYPEKRCGFFV